MEERIYQRLIKQIHVQFQDDATPALRDLRKEIDNLINP